MGAPLVVQAGRTLGAGECGCPELDPAWEYRQDSLEMLEAVAFDYQRSGVKALDLVMGFEEDVRGRPRLRGVRLGHGNPDWFTGHLAPDPDKGRYRTPGQVGLADKECGGCGKLFAPRTEASTYCCRSCIDRSGNGRRRTLPDYVCEVCGRVFRPDKSSRRLCSRSCAGVLSWGEVVGRMMATGRPLVELTDAVCARFRAMWLAGDYANDICETLGITLAQVRTLRRKLALPSRGVGRQWKSTPAKQAAMTRMWLAGEPTAVIERDVGISHSTLVQWKRELGLPARLSGNHGRAAQLRAMGVAG